MRNQSLGIKTDLHGPILNSSGVAEMEIQINAQEIKDKIKKTLEKDFRNMLVGIQDSNERIEKMIAKHKILLKKF